MPSSSSEEPSTKLEEDKPRSSWFPRWVPYFLLTLLTAFLTLAAWFLYHVYWGRLS